jgi:hypothetical protein
MNNTLGNQAFSTISCFLLGKERIALRTVPSDRYIPNRIVTAVVCSILIIPAVLLNAVAIVTIQKSSQLKNKLCYFTIMIQSAADLGVGCFTIPIVTCFLVAPFMRVDQCVLLHFIYQIGYVPTGISIVTLSVISMERYIGVVHPYSYESQVTKRRILTYIVGGTLVHLLVSILSVPIPEIVSIFMATILITFFIFTAFVYSRIYLVMKRLVGSEVRPSDAVDESRNKKKVFLRETKHARSCFAVVMCFIFCFTPFSFALVIFDNHGRPPYEAYLGWSLMLVISNSSLNSLIFLWTRTLLRKEAIKFLKSVSA